MNDKKIFGVAITAAVTALVGIGIGIKAACDNGIYNEDGFNNRGFNREGYDRDGYDKDGYNSAGYDRNGRDKDGYDKEGYDVAGYDVAGYDRDGRDRRGYDRRGYDKEGYDEDGFNSQGYKSNGLDCSDYGKEYYMQKIKEAKELLQSAAREMKRGELPYALHDIRIGLEKCIKCIIEHRIGEEYCEGTLHHNIEVCSEHELFSDAFIEKLMSAKNHCNDAQHDSDIEKGYNQVYFSYKVLEEVLELLERRTV